MVWKKTGLPVRSAVLEPDIQRSKFLKSLSPLQQQPYVFSLGAVMWVRTLLLLINLLDEGSRLMKGQLYQANAC
jgi:hypothetical protein